MATKIIKDIAERVRLTIPEILANGALTIEEMCEELGLTRSHIRKHLDILIEHGVVKRNDEKVLASNTDRWVYTFASTGKQYEATLGKDGNKLQPLTYNERLEYRDNLLKRGFKKVEDIDMEERLAQAPIKVRVNDFTTIYYNSRKKIQVANPAKRRGYTVGIASTFSVI